MKEPILSVKAMRESDAYTIQSGTPARTLMLRAGIGIFRSTSWSDRETVAIVCGSGNNAGDGYVLALLLADEHIPCRLYLTAERFSDDGAYYFTMCRARGISVTVLDEAMLAARPFDGCGVLVDCIFGTGFRGEPQGIAAAAIDAINASGARVLSVDINSGLCGDDGSFVRCVRSDLTVSIGFYQPGHFLGGAKDVIGARTNCDIGILPVGEPVGWYDPATGKAEFIEKA